MFKLSFIGLGKRLLFITITVIFSACTGALDWPKSPLYDLDKTPLTSIQDIEIIKEKIAGHYAHFDVVAYEDTTTQEVMKTFIISYGFTTFHLENGKLIQSDRFVRASQKINQKNINSEFSDEAVQAIKPRTQEVELINQNGEWQLYRKATPSLLGINGDPSLPLSTDPDDPNLTDPDNDGHPGVTVKINIANVIDGEIYITRREIFSNYLTVNTDGTLTGFVKDESEQFVIGASRKILAQPSNSIQHPDKGLSPILLVPIDPEIDTPEELMNLRDQLFPAEPEFLQ